MVQPLYVALIRRKRQTSAFQDERAAKSSSKQQFLKENSNYFSMAKTEAMDRRASALMQLSKVKQEQRELMLLFCYKAFVILRVVLSISISAQISQLMVY